MRHEVSSNLSVIFRTLSLNQPYSWYEHVLSFLLELAVRFISKFSYCHLISWMITLQVYNNSAVSSLAPPWRVFRTVLLMQ